MYINSTSNNKNVFIAKHYKDCFFDIVITVFRSKLPALATRYERIFDAWLYQNKLPIVNKIELPTCRYKDGMIIRKHCINNHLIEQNKFQFCFPIIVAIDAGHGGQDPGATGQNGLLEKDVTIAIARKLKMLLDKHPSFKPFLIRERDVFISIGHRSSVARNNKAGVLISIHVDSYLNKNVKGASVWVLSNKRANIEMMNYWLIKPDQQYKLLGGLGDILSVNKYDSYLTRLFLDLEFSYSQRVGYDIALHMLYQLQGVINLHKHLPEYSNFGILTSPDIPSLLVETGFISNSLEESLLKNNKYQEKIAVALYKGLCSYFSVKIF